MRFPSDHEARLAEAWARQGFGFGAGTLAPAWARVRMQHAYDQILAVAAGRAVLTIGWRSQVLVPGQEVVVPAGTRFLLRNGQRGATRFYYGYRMFPAGPPASPVEKGRSARDARPGRENFR